MPLKHWTETFLVFLLGLAIVVTGLVLPLLPPLLPQGSLSFGVLLGVSLLYPVVLYPILKRNRADYTFRLLHWLPTVMVLVWSLLQVIVVWQPQAEVVERWYGWGGTLFGVAFSFLLLAVFCLQVIRRRMVRLTLLFLLFAAFCAVTFADARYPVVRTRLVAYVQNKAMQIASSAGSVKAVTSSSGAAQSSINMQKYPVSSHPEEEDWRKLLRSLDDWEQTTSRKTSSAVVMGTGAIFTVIPAGPIPTKPPVIARKPATRLPSSGFDIGLLVMTTLGVYSGVVHQRARRREMS